MMTVHMIEAKFLLLEVYTTTLYIESQYLTHEVNTHHWGKVPTVNGLYY